MNDLYKRSVLRLTVIYVGIIALIAIFFSFNLYQVASYEIQNTLDKHDRQLQNRGFKPPDLVAVRHQQLLEARSAIVGRLVVINIIIIGAGGLGSYLLAKRTLQPIKDAHDAQEQFTSDASHELRTPLTSMTSEIEVALRNKSLTKQQAVGILSSNLEDIRSMSELTNNLLTLTKNKKIAQASFESIDLAKLVHDIEKSNRTLASSKKVTIATNIPKNTKVLGHNTSVRQIISVLLDNAIKYSKPKSKVLMKAHKSGKHIVISIADSGPGVSEKDLARIFDRFYQVDSARSKPQQGYGLGLAIAQRLAHAQGTNITATSTKQGSVFSFRLRSA